MIKTKLILLIVLSFCFSNSYSQVKLPKLISDSAIFQRDTEIEIFGSPVEAWMFEGALKE
jgi:hypothetical protein